MDKYTNEELKAMAIRIKQAKEEGDPKYFDFCMMVQIISGCDQEFLEAKIEEYANY